MTEARRRVEQVVQRNDRQLGDERLRVAPNQDDEAAQTVCARPLHEAERRALVTGEQSRCAVPQRGGDRALVAGLGRDLGQGETLAELGERTGGGREPFALGDRELERAEPLARRPRTLGQVVPLAGSGARGSSRLVRRLLEVRRGRVSACGPPLGIRVLRRERCEQRAGALAPAAETLPDGAERQPSALRVVLSAAGTRDLRLDRGALAAQGLEPRLRRRNDRRFGGGDARVRDPGTLGSLAARLRRVTRRSGRLDCGGLECDHSLVRARRDRLLRIGQLLRETRLQRRRGLAADREPLGRALQPVERPERRLAAPGRVGELLLGPLTLASSDVSFSCVERRPSAAA